MNTTVNTNININYFDSTIRLLHTMVPGTSTRPWLQADNNSRGILVLDLVMRIIIEVRENVCFACTEEVIPSSTR